MKKTKILMPLTGVAALGAVTPVIMATTSCNKNKDVTISDLIITRDVTEVPTLYVGTTINKSQFRVDVKMSDDTVKENVSGWTCDKFDTEGNYMFTSETPVEFTFVYEEFKKTMTYTATTVADAQFLSDTYTINYDATNTISTSAKLTILSKGSIMVLEPTLFNWKVEDPTKLDIDSETGIVTAKATTDGVKVTATYKDETKNSSAIECTVAVKAATINFDATNKTLTIDNTLATTDNVYAVPRVVTTSDGAYDVEYVTKSSSAAADNIKTLILPYTIRGIGAGTFASCPLQKIYYNGTQTQWMLRVYRQTEENWAGDMAIGVECTDGMLLFDNRYDTVAYNEASGKTDGKYLALDEDTTLGAWAATTYTVRFDYSELTDLTDAAAARNVTIQAYKNNILWESAVTLTINHIYVDGVEEKINDSKWAYTGGKLQAQTTSALTNKSVVVVNFTTPEYQVLNRIHMTAAKLAE